MGWAEARCRDCDRPLPYARWLGRDRFCGEACRRRYEALRPDQVCLICARPLSFAQLGGGACGDAGCRFETNRRVRAGLRLRREAFLGRIAAARDALASRLEILDPAAFQPVAIPASGKALVPVDERRRDALRENLAQLLRPADDAGDGPDPAATPAAAAHPALARACALCEGACCVNGREHAYLTTETLGRYAASRPGLGPDAVRDAYLDRVEEVTVEDSCIFHGRAGCSLSRDMRSDTCNVYECEGLRELRSAREAGVSALFLASVRGDEIVSALFALDGEETAAILDEPLVAGR